MAGQVTVPARHGTFDLEALDDTKVSVYCADEDCGEPLGVANVMTWGQLAEDHYWKKKAASEVGS